MRFAGQIVVERTEIGMRQTIKEKGLLVSKFIRDKYCILYLVRLV